MKRTIGLILGGFILGGGLFCLPAPLQASAADTAGEPGFSHETPLMVIRFNQQHVDYPMPLYNTVSRALAVKPSAVFDIVSIAPRSKEASNQGYYNNLAEKNTDGVLATLHNIGLPAKRISVVNAIDDVSVSEVRIFVH